MTTNQKAVGSNPAGLTNKRNPEALKNQVLRGFSSFWLACGKLLLKTGNNCATTDLLPTRSERLFDRIHHGGELVQVG